MNNWNVLHRIIKGNLRPYLVNSGEEIAIIASLRDSKKPDIILGELTDLEYPEPIGSKSEVYYWLIKYETRAIEGALKDLMAEFPNKEQLQQEITRHLLYGINLKEESRVLRLRIYEAPEAKMIDEDCYALGCCETYIDLLLNEILNFYRPIFTANEYQYFNLKLNSEKLTRIQKVGENLENLILRKKEGKVPLFQLNVSEEEHEKSISMLYEFFKDKMIADTGFPQFKRHFLETDHLFKQIVWISPVPLLKYIFNHLIEKKVILRPCGNLDHLILLHFINKKHEPLDENYLSQSLARLRGSKKANQIEKELDLIISHFISNHI